MKSNLLPFIALLVSIVISIIALPYLPEKIIIHWDIQGSPNLFVGKYMGLFIFPIIIAITWFIHTFLIKKVYYKYTLFLLLAIYLVIHIVVILFNLNLLNLNIEISGIIIGLIMIIISPPMKNTKINSLYGIRTIWSMKNEEAWKRSNKFGADVMTLWGIFSILASILLPSKYVIAVVLGVGLILFLIIIYASYYFYKQSVK